MSSKVYELDYTVVTKERPGKEESFMTKDYAAIIVSSLSMLVASLSLGWNIYRDIILKAKLKVDFSPVIIAGGPLQGKMERLSISATNHGPGKIKLTGIYLAEKSLLKKATRKTKFAFLIYDYMDPLSGKLPCELEVGNEVNLFLSFEKCFLSMDWTHIGIKDSFGRIHWAPRRNIVKAKKTYRDKFLPHS
ncbi:MAG: hypothetical protein V1806_04260 [Pseudomonadota bacterium]